MFQKNGAKFEAKVDADVRARRAGPEARGGVRAKRVIPGRAPARTRNLEMITSGFRIAPQTERPE
jgi:hypothetical protein